VIHYILHSQVIIGLAKQYVYDVITIQMITHTNLLRVYRKKNSK